MQSASLTREIAFITVAALSFALIGTLGGEILAHYSVAPGPYIGDESIAAMYWIAWGGRIVGRLCGDLTCGFLLGRYLRRIDPWYVLLGILGISVAILVINRGFWGADDGLWVETVGSTGAVAQHIIRIIAMAAVVALGIWLGQRANNGGESDVQQ